MTNEQRLDVRSLEPCEPQTRILDVADKLPAGGYLHVLHRMKPGVLGEILKSRGFSCHAHSGGDVPVEMFIWRDGDRAARAALSAAFGDIIPAGAGKMPFLPASPFAGETFQNVPAAPSAPLDPALLPNLSGLAAERVRHIQAEAAQALSLPTVFRDSLPDGGEAAAMCVLPAGTFRMGDMTGHGEDGERPAHQTVIAKPFAVGVYPVTVEEFARFADATGYRTRAEQEGVAAIWRGERWEQSSQINWRNFYAEPGRYPVVFITWFDAVAYCQWLSAATGQDYRLPSEIEWEYACRAGSEADWCYGSEANLLADYAWYRDNAGGSPHPVGEKKPNAFGLYDMHGNVAEWTASPWRYYDENEEYEITRVVRGGSWDNTAHALRAAHRCLRNPVNRNSIMGFRLARTL